MKSVIKFIKEYTKEDLRTDIKYFGSIILYISIAYIFYIILYNLIK